MYIILRIKLLLKKFLHNFSILIKYIFKIKFFIFLIIYLKHLNLLIAVKNPESLKDLYLIFLISPYYIYWIHYVKENSKAAEDHLLEELRHIYIQFFYLSIWKPSLPLLWMIDYYFEDQLLIFSIICVHIFLSLCILLFFRIFFALSSTISWNPTTIISGLY